MLVLSAVRKGSPGTRLNAVRNRFSRDSSERRQKQFSRDSSDRVVLVVGKRAGDSIGLMFQHEAAVRVVTVVAVIKFTPQ